MAFATSNVKLSSAGDRWRLNGDWTSIAGDTSGTITLGGAKVYDVNIERQDSTLGTNRKLDYSVSLSGALSTVTVTLDGMAVSSGGRFSIEFI